MTAPSRPRPRRRAPVAAVALAAALTLAGCGGDEADGLAESEETASETVTPTPTASPSAPASDPASDPAPEPTDEPRSIDVTISSDQVSPMAEPVELAVGETLRLAVRSNRAGELHVHSNPEQTVALARGRSDVDLVFDKPGQVDVEEHESGVLILRVLVR